MDKRLRHLETIFKALGDETRLRILGLLGAGEICVCHIHESLGIAQPKASRHLAYLKRAGLVQDRKDGLWVHYRLADPADPVLRALISAARHSLSHLNTTSRDRQRLEREIGSQTTAAETGASVWACCQE